jgi:hypothetical protein
MGSELYVPNNGKSTITYLVYIVEIGSYGNNL